MLKKILIFLIILSIGILYTLPALANCNCTCGDGSKQQALSSSECGTACIDHNGTVAGAPCEAITGGRSSGSGSQPGDPVTIKNPLDKDGGGQVQPDELYARLISGLLAFVGVASLIAFVYAGFIFLTSAGSAEKVKKAKDTMVYAVIGILVSMASYAILSFIFKTLETATNNPSTGS